MDDRRFDSLAKAFASGTSRRSMLKGILGLGGVVIAGSAALDRDVEAARRPTPTPRPVTCPGRQTWNGSHCACPDDAPVECGPDCCTEGKIPAGSPGYSECCDNGCCFGTCYGEELCCPTNTPAGGGAPIASVCANGECCLLPNICTNGVCGAPSGCQNNDDCGDCETCNPNTRQCNSLCTSDLPQCCVNGFGQYCIPADETCCSSPSHCTEPCSYCNDVVRYCVDRCEGDEICCEGASEDDCCTTDRCVAGQGCCDEGFIACGGRCCRADVYFCNQQDDCECLPGTEACGQVVGGCCPDGQCNEDGVCCPGGTTACGSSCCDNTSQTCGAESVCICASGWIECNGLCIEAQCCGADNAACAELGYDLQCVACVEGTCAAARNLENCGDGNRWCSNGQCLACIPYLSYGCTYDNQCCNGSCLGGRCDTQ